MQFVSYSVMVALPCMPYPTVSLRDSRYILAGTAEHGNNACLFRADVIGLHCGNLDHGHEVFSLSDKQRSDTAIDWYKNRLGFDRYDAACQNQLICLRCGNEKKREQQE